MPRHVSAVSIQPSSRRLVAVARALFLGLGLCAAMPVLADVPAEPPPVADATVRAAFDVPAGSLGDALALFAAQAGLPFSFDAALTQGKTSEGLRGDYGIDQGFAQLLAGTGLQAVRQGDGRYSLQPRPPSMQDATLMPTVKVEASAGDGSAEQGYRSRKISAVGPWQGRELQDTPYSITVVSKDLIESLQATTPDQVFRTNPTTLLSRPQRENDQPTVYMRGFVVSSAYNDGVPSDQLGHSTTTENVEQIEILSGLSGFLYGFGNVGGTLNYLSKRPTPERFNRVTLGSNGGESYYAQGDFGGPVDAAGRVGYRINLMGQDGETVVDRQKIGKTFFSAAIDWRATDRLLLQFLASKRDYEPDGHHNWSFAPGVARYSPDRLDPSVSWGQPWADSYYRNTKYGAQARWEASDMLALRAAWYENRNERSTVFARNAIQADGSYEQTVFNYFPAGTNPLSSEHEDGAGYLFADLQLRTGPFAHKITTGLQRRQSVDARFENNAPGIVFSGLSLDAPTYLPRPVLAPIDRGAFIKPRFVDNVIDNFIVGDDITLSERWSLLVGAAHTVIDDRLRGDETSATTPTASIIFKPATGLTTYASFMEALEQGGVAADQFGGAPVVNAGDIMDPLKSRQFELGAKFSRGELAFGAAVFQIDKALQYYDISNPAAPVFVQDGRQVHRGIEFTVIGKATADLTLIGGLTWLDAEVREQKQTPALEGKRPAMVAEEMAKLRAEYRMPMLPALTLIGGIAYNGDRYFDAASTDRLPAYTLIDAGARYAAKVAGHPLTLRAEFTNASDKRYWANGSVVGDPRTLLFSVSTDF